MKKLTGFLKNRLRIRGKIILGAIGATFLLFLGSTQYTHADIISDIAYGAVASVCFLIAYAIAWITGVAIAIEAWFIGIVLNINAGVFQTSFVQTGFSISLSVANLAFVLGIIVIAIATILRIENYSIKKMLWKLVVMAILVNFGLVIIAPIFGFSNSITQYFMNAIAPSTSSGMSSFNTFATTLTSRFNPQAVITSASNITSSTSAGDVGALNGLGTGVMSPHDTGQGVVGAMMIPIFDLAFTVVDLGLIVFVLGAFFVMLIIRYLYIAILAILLPFAWASWVFPSFSSMYSKWWNKFLQWTFFAPIFMFFLYLALATIGGSNTSDAFNSTATYTTSNSAFGFITAFFGNSITVILSNFLNEMILAGLILAGLVAADTMGVKFAGSAIKVAQNAGKGVQGYVGKQSKKAGRATFNKAGRATFNKLGGQRAVNAMREGRFLGLQGVPGLKWATSRAASTVATAVTPHLKNSDLVEAEKKNVSKDHELVKSELKGNLNKEKVFARIASLAESGKLTKDTKVGNQNVGDWMDAHKDDVEAYGFKKSAHDADVTLGNDEGMRTAQNRIDTLRSSGADAATVAAAEGAKDTATDAFVAKLEKSDIPKMNLNDIFKEKVATPLAAALAKSFAAVGPHLVSSAIPKMNSQVKDNFADIYKGQINSERAASPNLKIMDAADEEIKALEKEKEASPDIQRLRDEIENVKVGEGFDVDKAEKIKALNSQISQTAKTFDAKIATSKAKKEAAKKLLNKREQNLESALDTFEKSLGANAVFGAFEAGTGQAPASAPAPAPPSH